MHGKRYHIVQDRGDYEQAFHRRERRLAKGKKQKPKATSRWLKAKC